MLLEYYAYFSPLNYRKDIMGLKTAQGWASELNRGLEDRADGKYRGLQSRVAEAKKEWGSSLNQRKGKDGEQGMSTDCWFLNS